MNHEKRIDYVARDWAHMICSLMEIHDKEKIGVVEDIVIRAAHCAVEIEARPLNSSQVPKFDEPISDIGDLFTLKEFQDSVAAGAFIDYDGYGFPACKTDDGFKYDRELIIRPSEADDIPVGTTHVYWFNR
jgi:hypothetical protein